jgi:pyruvyltransferase
MVLNFLRIRALLLLMVIQSFLLAIPQNCYGNTATSSNGLPLFYWQENPYVNFGDYLSLKLVERIVNQPVRFYKKKNANKEKKLLALGSILTFAWDNDVVWGSGVNGKWMDLKYYTFKNLDVRAVRGPLTRDFLIKNFQIECPEVYGDPALLVPSFFPEFQKKENPSYDYIIIPHYSERALFPKEVYVNVVDPLDPWDQVIEKIIDSKFVISSSLHGIVVAEAFGIPARQLRVTENEHIFKYKDYYLGTNRPNFRFATSVQDALEMGGEEPFDCDLKKLYDAFPLEFWH